MPDPAISAAAPRGEDPTVAAVRRFSRFYTARIGLVGRRLYDSDLGLAEARVLFELAARPTPLARDLARDTGIDPGQLSRILAVFARRGWLERSAATSDRRRKPLALTPAGRVAFARIDEASHQGVAALLAPLAPGARARLATALETAEELLGGEPAAPVALRPHEPGDIGWIVSRHGALYAQEYGWDQSFEALVAEIAGNFLKSHDPARERCFIAARVAERLGSAMVVRQSDGVAKLRLVLVEPAARGSGLGRRLVGEAIAFARIAGYRRMTLWTNDILQAARAIYVGYGFRLVAEERHRSFGHDLVGQNWELDL